MPDLSMGRKIGCGVLGLVLVVLLLGACSAGHVFASPYQSGLYYPYWPWYWGGHYYSYSWTTDNYVSYHGGYTPSGSLASGYHYDSGSNTVIAPSGKPAYPKTNAVSDIHPANGVPDPRTLANAPASVKASSSGCSGQNACTGGGNAATNKSSGGSSGGASGSSCSGQSACAGGGNAATNKASGSTNSAASSSDGAGGGAATNKSSNSASGGSSDSGSGGAATNKSSSSSGSTSSKSSGGSASGSGSSSSQSSGRSSKSSSGSSSHSSGSSSHSSGSSHSSSHSSGHH